MSREAPSDGLEIRYGDARYPRSVAALADAPRVLYVRGDPDALAVPSLSVVGSRMPTPYGLATTELAARLAVEAGLQVVSGGARGCDCAAGMAALDAGGRHVIVLGTGADVVYPRSSEALIERTLAEGGAVVSVAPWGTQPQRFLFPKRNRVIAALSQATFIGEAGLPSGTFSTAEAAIELGHEVLVVPGSIFSSQSRGANYLIGIGACCIADEEALEMAISRIYGRLRRPHGTASPARHRDRRWDRVLDAVVASPLRSDDVAALLGCDIRAALELLGDVTAAGAIEQGIDGRYIATKASLHARTALGHNGVQRR